MGAGRVLFVGSPEADDAFDDDQGRFVLFGSKFCVGRVEADQVVGVADRDDLPAQTFETAGDVFAECQFGTAFDRDLVVVVDPTEVRKFQMPGQ